MPSPQTDNDIVTDIIKEEVGNGPALVNDPVDKGGLTYEGISSRANPDLFVNGLPTDPQVRARYEERYIKGPGFDQIADMKVRSLLADWGVTSGPTIAIQALQTVVKTTVDGVLGPKTAALANAMSPSGLIAALVSKRVQMIGRIVSKNPSQVRFLSGWLGRAVEWLL